MKAAFLLTEDRVQVVLSPQTKTETAILDLLHDGQDKVVEAHRANFVERNGYSDFPPLRNDYGVAEIAKDTLLVVSRRTPEPVLPDPTPDPRVEGLYEEMRATLTAVALRFRGDDTRDREVAALLKGDLVNAALDLLNARGINK